MRSHNLPEVLGAARGLARLTAPGESKEKKKKTTGEAQLFLRDQTAGALPCARSQVTTQRLHNQACCGLLPSENTLVQSQNVFLAHSDSDGPSIMTFSAIGPWLVEMQCL